MADVKIATHPKQVFRVSRGDPWAIRAPRGNNRFDICDPEEGVMTLYTGESKEAALAEVLAPFRPDLETIAEVDSIPSDDDVSPVSGVVPKHWLETRRIGIGIIRFKAVIVDITHPKTIQVLRNQSDLARQAIKAGFVDIDESSLRASGVNGRRFTQAVSAYIYNIGHSGIRYGSRLGTTFHCVAGFVAIGVDNATWSEFLEAVLPSEKISSEDTALKNVVKLFNLKPVQSLDHS